MPSVQAFALIGEARPGNCQLQIQTPPVKTGGAKDCIRTFIQTSKLHPSERNRRLQFTIHHSPPPRWRNLLCLRWWLLCRLTKPVYRRQYRNQTKRVNNTNNYNSFYRKYGLLLHSVLNTEL